MSVQFLKIRERGFASLDLAFRALTIQQFNMSVAYSNGLLRVESEEGVSGKSARAFDGF
jgi:hypothetical protein